ncbi:trafficking protein particle complex subunit 2 [Piedraia hortae CBS 480.64]|uniref:Trafficking protein particle complex subunit 2 n=1 Tax=Piedraia hortae CBS 480.64 TaxID=1314780 RepID=A0A6A7C0A6_9PEZI|nr:trafficking protein particle complex subunit 2 [Piedraia hortae CBS 480.64]
MSYFFTIVSPLDRPLFSLTFGSSKPGGDGTAHFPADATAHWNEFLTHASLDLVEESMTTTRDLYLKRVDSFQNNHIHAFVTPGGVRMLLLMNAESANSASSYSEGKSAAPVTALGPNSLAANPLSQATEDAVKSFMNEVFEAWVKCIMNPFYDVNMPVRSPVFRSKVVNAGRKFL